ncbi:MAG: LCP family protein [Candidatus Daviesbacteria bacterium]|nr:MAG: LCP family protein [Candidatus Daviesbacteria bacterium]
MSETAETITNYQNLVTQTRRPTAWNETLSLIPSDSTDPILDLIQVKAIVHQIILAPKDLQKLANEYDNLREMLSFDPNDPTIDHSALVDLFLQQKGLVKEEKRRTKRKSSKVGRFSGAGLATAIALGTLGGVVASTPMLRDTLTQVDITKVPDIKINQAPYFLRPFIVEANKKRLERAKFDSGFFHRVDPELNRNRLNIALHHRGQDFNPGMIKPQDFDTITILSYNSQSNAFDIISFADLRAPELEQKQDPKQGIKAKSISRAYREGGFDLMRQTLEDATGLVIDDQVSMSDEFLADLFNSLGGIPIEIPWNLRTTGTYIGGNPQLPFQYEKGIFTLGGKRVINFMKARQANANDDWKMPEKRRERRQVMILEAFLGKLGKISPDEWKQKIAWFLETNILKDKLDTDFNHQALIINNLNRVAEAQAENPPPPSPKVRQTTLVADRNIGDGGVQGSFKITTNQEVLFKDKEGGVFDDDQMNVPFGNVNPYAKDLVHEYWEYVRKFIKDRFTSSLVSHS